MKKLFFSLTLVAASLFLSSCATDNESLPPSPPTAMSFSYTGALQVGDFSMDDVVVSIDINTERAGYMNIAMRGVRFSDKMPMSLDIVLNEIPCLEGDGVLLFSGADIVPLVAGQAAEAYRFKFISGRVNADASGITFVAQMANDLAAHVAGMVFVYDAGLGSEGDVVTPPVVENFSYNFEGALQVGAYELPGAVVSASVNREAGTVDIKMNGVRFSDRMPMMLDITLCGLACENAGGVIRFWGENIKPVISVGNPDDYVFAVVSGEFDMKASTLVLNAKMADDLAAYVAGLELVYNGDLKR